MKMIRPIPKKKLQKKNSIDRIKSVTLFYIKKQQDDVRGKRFPPIKLNNYSQQL